MTRNALLKELADQTTQFIDTTSARFIVLDDFVLNQKQNPATWSILECFEHLNRYNRYYNPALSNAIQVCTPLSVDVEATSTWLGRKFIQMMEPSNVKKQRTLTRMNPANSFLSRAVMHEFIGHQLRLLEIISLAKEKDIHRASVPVEFFKLLRLTPSDALRFIIVHQQRHFLQLEKILTVNQEAVLKV